MKFWTLLPAALLCLSTAAQAVPGALSVQDAVPQETEGPTISERRESLEQQLLAAQALAEGQPEGSTASEVVTAYLQAQVALEALEQAQDSLAATRAQLGALGEQPEFEFDPAVLPQLPDLQDPQLDLQVLSDQRDRADQGADEAEAALAGTKRRNEAREAERADLPAQIAVLREQLAALAQETTAADAGQDLLQAQAERRSIQADRYEAEIASALARLDYLEAVAPLELPRERQRDLAAKAWSQLAAVLDGELSARQLQQVESEATEAEELASELEQSRFAEQAKRIAILKSVLVTRQRSRDQVEARIEQIARNVELLDERFQALRERYESAGRSNQMGLLLRNEAQQLDEPLTLRREIERLQPEIILRTMQLLDTEEELARISKQGPPANGEDPEFETANALFEQELSTWIQIQNVLSDLRKNLELELAARQDKLERTTEFYAYVNERVLWVQSAAPIWRWSSSANARPTGGPDVDGSPGDSQALEWLTSDAGSRPVNRLPSLIAAGIWLITPGHWGQVVADLWGDILDQPLLWSAMALALLILLLIRRRLFERLDLLVDEGQGPAIAVYRPLAECLVITGLLALPIPLLLAFLGQELVHAGDGVCLLPASLGAALRPASLFWFLLAFTRISCRPEGLVPSHLHVPGELARRIRRRILLLAVMMVSSLTVFRTLAAYGSLSGGTEQYVNTLGRLVFLFLLGLLVFFNHGLRAGPNSAPSAKDEAGQTPIGEFPRRLGRIFGVGLMVGVVVLALASMLGYVYTASELFDRLLLTLALLTGLLLALLVATRLVEITKRRVAAQRIRAQLTEGGGPGEPATEKDPDKPSLSQVSAQARQLLSTFVGILTALGLYWVWIDVVPALGIFRQIELWQVEQPGSVADGSLTGSSTTLAVTLADLMLALFWVLAGFVTGTRLPVLMDLLVFERLQLRGGERYAIQAISRYILTLIGLALGFAALRIGWNDVQFLAAAISVGLGFGLQEIFANFVSGLILLFERPVRIGDWVAIGDVTGQVARIQIRATTVMDLDRRELIVPNKDFVTSRLINYSLTDSITRARVDVGIAYGSDTKLAKRLLIDCAKQTMGVVAAPPAKALFAEFGDSSLNFTLFIFIDDRERMIDICSDLNFRIDDAFRKAGIEISFPQRDLHVRTAPGLEHVAELQRMHDQERAAGAAQAARPPGAGSAPDSTPGKGPLDV